MLEFIGTFVYTAGLFFHLLVVDDGGKKKNRKRGNSAQV